MSPKASPVEQSCGNPSLTERGGGLSCGIPVEPGMTPSQTTLSDSPSLSIGIVIATRNRPEPLRVSLASINSQTLLPSEVIIVDSSPGTETQNLIELLQNELRYYCGYRHSSVASAAQQRNLGADLVKSDIILFLDDDVVAEPEFLMEIRAVFQSDQDGMLGGVSGTMTNCVYADPRRLNRFLLGLCTGKFTGTLAGRILGPALWFLPSDGPEQLQPVEWLAGCCCAYRRDVFLAYRFGSTFQGYSFAEDIHLSTRIGRRYRLANTTRARLFHADLGRETHRDWAALGESQVVNRHMIMTEVLGRNRILDHIRLFGFEIIYTSLALIAAGEGPVTKQKLASLIRGKLKGFRKIWTAKSLRTRQA